MSTPKGMRVNGPDAMEQERRLFKRLVYAISSVEVDWMVGLVTAENAMKTISKLLEDSKK